MPPTSIPADFPRAARLGAVSGAQPKRLAQKEDNGFVPDADDSEVHARYQMCEDLARQLERYTLRKGKEHPDWSREVLLAKVSAALKAKAFGWGLSPAETDWVLTRMRALAGLAGP